MQPYSQELLEAASILAVFPSPDGEEVSATTAKFAKTFSGFTKFPSPDGEEVSATL